MSMISIDELKEIFRNEFSSLVDRFNIFELPLLEATASKEPDINWPGVYVHWSPAVGPVKVGKSQKNSRKRAMEHIRDNTPKKNSTYGMAQLANEPGAKVVLFNVISKEDVHWVLAVEHYLERKINAFVKSDRNS